MFPRSQLALAAASLATLACACTAPAPDAPREWLEVTGAIVDPRGGDDPIQGAAPAIGIGGGFDFNDDPIVVSWELGALWSQHDVELAGQTYRDELEVLRILTGVRARARLHDLPLGVHLRGGFEWRGDEGSDSNLVSGNDQWGLYGGAGLDWWYSPFASMGPEILWFHGQDDGLDELHFALSARFY
ncbi:MAG: hypothetical protein HUU28_05795 [Planctomycetaceae bacterium]|nr:hypothetical protein [Planctomycetaceae bacterium]